MFDVNEKWKMYVFSLNFLCFFPFYSLEEKKIQSYYINCYLLLSPIMKENDANPKNQKQKRSLEIVSGFT